MQRRSAQRSIPRRKYTVDAFEGIAELQSAASGSDNEGVQYEDASSPNDDSEEDFQPPTADADLSSAIDSASDPGPEANAPEDNEAVSDAGDRPLDSDVSVIGDEYAEDTPPNSSQHKGTKRKRIRREPATPPGPKLYTRGVPEVHVPSTNVSARRQLFFGKAREDVEPAVRARDWWAGVATVPTREGLRGSFYADEESTKGRTREEGREWRKKGGMERCFRMQQVVRLVEVEAREYIDLQEAKAVSFLMGPFDDQELFKLPVGGSMQLSDAWPGNEFNSKNGLLLNVGTRVHCLDWAPHQKGQFQYLATSVLPKRESTHLSHEAAEAPAFTPQQPYKACVRIWAIKQAEDGRVDGDGGCRLEMVLCTEWGDAKELRFCPMPFEEDTDDSESLGLLAGLWGDGAVRILRLPAPQPGTPTTYNRIETAAFSSRPSNTVCTSITWLSSTRLAAGCANGSVSIWDLPTSLTSPSPNPRPETYTTVSSSYILSISSCYPSRPHLLLTTSIAGSTALTDTSRAGQSLGSPSNTVLGNKSRIVHRGLVWHDNLQSAVHAEDNYRVVASPLRRFFTDQALVRARSSVTALAASPCHTSILVGSASGEVIATNPMRRLLDSKPNTWQQTWFAHEWRRPTAEEVAGRRVVGEDDDLGGNGADAGATGMSRISEGFKAERNVLANDGPVGYDTYNGAVFTTVYEGQSAITALAWNPNLQTGGWAAAGMGDGLLRIEDLAM